MFRKKLLNNANYYCCHCRYHCYYLHNTTCTHSRTLLFGSTRLKHGLHFDYWNQFLNIRIRFDYLDIMWKICRYKKGLGNAHPVSCPMGYGGSLSGGKVAWAWSRPIHFHLVPRNYISPPKYIFEAKIAWASTATLQYLALNLAQGQLYLYGYPYNKPVCKQTKNICSVMCVKACAH
jgi:hypothetical protein